MTEEQLEHVAERMWERGWRVATIGPVPWAEVSPVVRAGVIAEARVAIGLLGPGVRGQGPAAAGGDRLSRPRVVCLCGSTRFGAAFDEANKRETLAGAIVLSIGCVTNSDAELGITPEQKALLDALHIQKIDLADEVLILNVGGYIGESTRSELAYARRIGKPVRWLKPGASECVEERR